MLPNKIVQLLTSYHDGYKKYCEFTKKQHEKFPWKSDFSINFREHLSGETQKLKVEQLNKLITEAQGFDFHLRESFIANDKSINVSNRWYQQVEISKNIAGFGVYAIKKIEKNTTIPYSSIMFSKEKGFSSPFDCYNLNHNEFYFTTQFIGGLGRFINHGFKANEIRGFNLEPDVVSPSNLAFITIKNNDGTFPYFIVTQDIYPGEQLLVDYGAGYWLGCLGYFHISERLLFNRDEKQQPVALPNLMNVKDSILAEMPKDYSDELSKICKYYSESILKKEIPTHEDWIKFEDIQKTAEKLVKSEFFPLLSHILEKDLTILQECADEIKKSITVDKPHTPKKVQAVKDYVCICSFIAAHRILKQTQHTVTGELLKDDEPINKKDVPLSLIQLYLGYESLTRLEEEMEKLSSGFFKSFNDSKSIEDYKKTTQYLKQYTLQYLNDHPSVLENNDISSWYENHAQIAPTSLRHN
jgi:hypothetical protein